MAKNRCEQLSRDTQHGIDESAVEIHVGADGFEQMTAFRDQLPGDALYSAVEFKLFLHSLDRGEFSRVLLQKNLPGIRQRVYRVAHTVNQSRAVEGLVIQNFVR